MATTLSRAAAAAAVTLGAAAQAQVSLASLLGEMTDREAVTRLPDPAYTCRQSSSYDRASTAPGVVDDKGRDTWFANGDAGKYLRVEERAGRREHVMMDAAGPGAIVRIWSANPKGTLRIYLDGAEAPALEAPMTDILGGKWAGAGFTLGEPLSGVRARGWNLYLPIPYASRCVVTSDEGGFYYQVNYRTYEAGTRVEGFSIDAVKSAAAKVAGAGGALLHPTLEGPPAGRATGLALNPGKTVTLLEGKGEGAIAGLRVRVKAADLAAALCSTVLAAEFDGEGTVWCPLSEFFGTGAGLSPMQDWWRTVSADGWLESRWVMPHEKSFRVTLENHGAQTVTADFELAHREYTWDDRSAHFHATWRREHPIHAYGGRGTQDFNYVEIAGAGLYLGDTLSIVNPVPQWWGEGDEKIYVDGEGFPSHFGTGTEDYYGYAWCWPEPFTHPFHSQSRCDGWTARTGPNNWGHTTVSRVRSLDAIPFSKSLKFDMEVWHWQECDVGYAAASFFYTRPGATTNRAPSPREAARGAIHPPPLPPPMKVEGAVECEGLTVVGKSEGMTVVPQGGFGPNLWSEDTQLWVQARRPGEFVELRVPCEPGPRSITVYATRSWDYGVIRFSVNGTRAGPDVDTYNTAGRAVAGTGPIDLGRHTVGDSFVLRAEVVGGNEKSEGTKSYFGLDCVVVK